MKVYNTDIRRKLQVLLLAFILWLCPVKETSAGIIPADSIRAAVIDSLNAFAEKNGIEIQVDVPYTVNVEVKAIEKPRIRVKVPSGKKLNSRVQVKVEFMNNEGETSRQVNVVARVKTFATAAAILVDLNRDDVITQEDVVIKKMNVTKSKDYFDSFSGLKGMQAKRKLKAGSILTRKNVEPIPVIRRGDRVVMKACIGNIHITAEGIAREDGGLNENIRVYNETTRKNIICRIINSQTVQIGGEGG